MAAADGAAVAVAAGWVKVAVATEAWVREVAAASAAVEVTVVASTAAAAAVAMAAAATAAVTAAGTDETRCRRLRSGRSRMFDTRSVCSDASVADTMGCRI